MKTSKWVRVDTNILLEYIYNSDNLLSEQYAVIKNTIRNTNTFASTLDITKNYADTIVSNLSKVQRSNTINQLVNIDDSLKIYSKLSLERFSFIQKKDFSPSYPIPYDQIKIHVPINYVFEDRIGMYLRVYVFDNDGKVVELSNYFFNISDVEQINDLEYSTPDFDIDGMSWGKYLSIQIPSTHALSNQCKNGVVTIDSINYNLSEVGISKTSPIFLEFHFVESEEVVNDIQYYKLSSDLSTSFPQTVFERLGVVIEQSTQGNFFEIYPVFNGTQGEFNIFMRESVYNGNRYYVDIQIDVYEKNILTNSQSTIITENFLEKIEFRPILKYTTTTAIIDVVMKLIDVIDDSVIERKASYGITQNEVSIYSNYLTKLNLGKIRPTEVHAVKSYNNTMTDSTNSTNTLLKVERVSFDLYSRKYNINTGTNIINLYNVVYTPQNKIVIDIYPFDNIIMFNTLYDNNTFFDYSVYTDLKFIIRSDKKAIEIDIYRDCDQNELSRGNCIFKIKEDKYSDIKSIYESGFSMFYITGKSNDIKNILYSGKFIAWDSSDNIKNLNRLFETNQLAIKQSSEKYVTIKKEDVIKETSVNNTGLPNSVELKSESKLNLSKQEILKELNIKLLKSWTPYWQSPMNILSRSYTHGFEEMSGYKEPNDLRDFAIKSRDYGLILNIGVNPNNGSLTQNTLNELDRLLGYMKIHNFNPEDDNILNFLSENKEDVMLWISSGDIKKVLPKSELTKGINQPPSKEIYEIIKEIIFNL